MTVASFRLGGSPRPPVLLGSRMSAQSRVECSNAFHVEPCGLLDVNPRDSRLSLGTRRIFRV